MPLLVFLLKEMPGTICVILGVPPLSLGRVSLVYLNLGGLLLQMKIEQALRKEVENVAGIRMGIVCMMYRNLDKIVILTNEALPNQETFKEFQHFRSSCVSLRIGVKLYLIRSDNLVGIWIPK